MVSPARYDGIEVVREMATSKDGTQVPVNIIKPKNMERNLERAGGFVCSEALLMKLAPAIGRGRAHVLVKELSDEARLSERSFSDAVRSHPVVRKHLSTAAIEKCVDYRAYLGHTKTLVNQVLRDYRRSLKRKR